MANTPDGKFQSGDQETRRAGRDGGRKSHRGNDT